MLQHCTVALLSSSGVTEGSVSVDMIWQKLHISSSVVLIANIWTLPASSYWNDSDTIGRWFSQPRFWSLLQRLHIGTCLCMQPARHLYPRFKVSYSPKANISLTANSIPRNTHSNPFNCYASKTYSIVQSNLANWTNCCWTHSQLMLGYCQLNSPIYRSQLVTPLLDHLDLIMSWCADGLMASNSMSLNVFVFKFTSYIQY